MVETRSTGEGIRRRRECLACGVRFSTQERIERKIPLIIKKSGSREPFDRDKVLRGLHIACRKRAVTAEQLDQAVERIEQQVVGFRSEVSSVDVGRLVLEELRELDLVGYLRFASVYQEVQSPDDFIKLLQPWTDRTKGST